MGKFKLKSGNTPTFKMMGSAFLQPSGEDIKEDLKERLNLENIKKPELNIDTEDLKERINIEKPKVNVETHVETPRSGEFTGDQGELRNPDLEQKTQEQLESQGYDDVNVIRGHRNPDDEPLRENRKKYYSHATATSGDANCCWVSTGLVGPSNCKSEAALPTNHPCACCLSVDPFDDCDVLGGTAAQNPISITLTCILNPDPSDPPCDTYLWRLEFSTNSMPIYKSDCVVVDGEGATGTASGGGDVDDDHRGCGTTICGVSAGAYWSGEKPVGTSDCPPEGTWVLTKYGGSQGVCHTPGPSTTGDHATACEARNAGLGSDTNGSDLTITLTAIP